MKKGGVRMTRRGFRETKGLLSGDVYVVGRSLRHSGVPEPVNAAPDASRKGKAATDDGSGKTAGGDATTSVATAAVRGTCAEVADSMAKKAKGTPKVKQVKTPEEQCGESGRSPSTVGNARKLRKRQKKSLTVRPISYIMLTNKSG